MLTFAQRHELAADWLNHWELPTGWHITQQPAGLDRHQRRHALLRRIAFFERRDDGWFQMLPYQHLERFLQVTRHPDADQTDLKHLLAAGISLAKGARDSTIAQHDIWLRAGASSGATIHSFRLFPVADFQVQIPTIGTRTYLEYTPALVSFFHAPQDPGERVASARRAELLVSLDLLELLAQIREGFTPSLDDISGFFINLVIFKHALTHLPYRRVLLTRDNKQFYELTREDPATIRLQKHRSNEHEEAPHETQP